ncbi:PKD domain-containing protein [bacterium]|nr:PKD domain-containing protein [bacterium]
MHKPRATLCILAIAFIVTTIAAIVAGACSSHIAGRIEPPEIAFMYPLDYYVDFYDQYSPAPQQVRLHVGLANVPDAIPVVSAVVDWGDGDGFQPVELPYGPGGIFRMPPNYKFELTHTYLEDGTYSVDVRIRDEDGRELSRSHPLELRIGPERRMFTDPRDGSTYEIYDGTVWVSFADWEHLSGFDHDMALEPDIAAFLEKENLRVRQEQAEIAAMEVILPGGGTTVEEAVGEWPSRYPELIESVDPNAISELF